MVLNNELTFEQVCGALGFTKSKGFVEKDASSDSSEQPRKWLEIMEKFGIDAIFLIQSTDKAPSIPVIYFKKLDKYDETKIVDLHKKIWNEGKIPLLYVILPSEIRIYNCFEPPCFSMDEFFNSKQRLIKYLKSLKNVEQIRRELSDYTCEKISSGRFWRDKENVFNINNRADMYLLKNLKTLRRVLQDEKLDNKIIHSLIGRSILLLCLEDRRALQWYFHEFKGGKYAKNGFREVLLRRDETYELFEFLNNQFDGDLFTVTEEEKKQVTDEQLRILRRFLQGTDLETGQTRLWPYRFDYIPLEFISNIYEEFFHYEKEPRMGARRQLGTHYTPEFLVDFMLDDILQWDTTKARPKILDPSCGSGIFLVEAYRKLITHEMQVQGKSNIGIEDLKRILKECIFGVDINGEAISITAFSLYLTMIDYIDLESLWKTKKIFPKLTNENLFPFDFFDATAPFNKMKFDVIIGNVPWASINKDSKTRALSFCRYSHNPIGDKQIAQAFMWKALNLSREGSKSCLIVSAKSLLFNRSNKNKEFRRSFLKKANIKTIVNLSAMRHDLFNKSVGPAAIIYYLKESFTKEKMQNSIVYITPKPSLETKYVGAIIINESDYAKIPIEKAIEDDAIWKIVMWGTPRDLELINRVRSMGTLGDIVKKRGWEMGDGFQRGGRDKNFAPWLIKYPHIPAKSLDKYYIHKNKLKKLPDNPIFNRPRTKKRYTSPLCLMKVTLKKGDLVATFSDFDVSYTDCVIGISGDSKDAEWLKILCCYLNSSVAKYFLFLTCSVWGVERDDILKSDLFDLPLVLPEENSAEYQEIVSIYDRIAKNLENSKELKELKEYRRQIDYIFFKLFNLSDIEKNLVMDTINYTIDYFQRRGNSLAIAPVDDDILIDYVQNIQFLLNSMVEGTGKTFYSEIYSGSEILKIVSFKFRKKNSTSGESKIKVYDKDVELERILSDLSPFLYEERCNKVLLRRILRIYENNGIHIIKPNEKRFWTRIAAYKDADITIADILAAWRDKKSVWTPQLRA